MEIEQVYTLLTYQLFSPCFLKINYTDVIKLFIMASVMHKAIIIPHHDCKQVRIGRRIQKDA